VFLRFARHDIGNLTPYSGAIIECIVKFIIMDC
jgi:hypothetical protein